MPDNLYISLTAVRSYQRCQQQYEYRYVRRLRRRDKAAAPELGIMIHEYLEVFYKDLQKGEDVISAHEHGCDVVRVSNTTRMQLSASIAHMAGADELAVEYLGLVDKAVRLCERYLKAHGLNDAQRYTFIYVEKDVESEVLPTIISRGKVDLVTQDQTNGRIHIWEHKSVTTEPPEGIRLFDLQTPLYVSQLDVDIDAVNWNYIRTKEPTIPRVLKAGGLSRDTHMDTTWECYADTIRENGLNIDDYMDMEAVFGGRESKIFFPRYEQVIITDHIILEDYKETGREIWRARKRWREGKARPIRSLARDCEFWCEFKMLCHTALTGGDEDDMIALRYTSSKRDDDAPSDNQA